MYELLLYQVTLLNFKVQLCGSHKQVDSKLNAVDLLGCSHASKSEQQVRGSIPGPQDSLLLCLSGEAIIHVVLLGQNRNCCTKKIKLKKSS